MTDAVEQRFTPLVPDSRPAPRTGFDMVLHKFLDDIFEVEPVWATIVGYHAFDDRWPNLSESGRQQRLSMLRHHRARLSALAEGELTPDEKIDHALVLEALDAWEFGEAVLRDSAWDPLTVIQQSGTGLFALLGRDFGPWAHRGAAFLGRVAGLPQLFADAQEALVGLPGRPVSLLHTETALKQLAGIPDLVEQGAAEAKRRAEAGEEPALAEAIDAAIPAARAAIEAYRAALEGEIRARAEGEGRLGGDLFAQKLRHTLSSELGHQEVLSRAERDYEVVRGEMVRLARQMWPEMVADKPLPEDDSEIVRGVLDVIAQQHPRADELLEFCRTEVGHIEQFCRERDLIGLPSEPLQITWTPVFMRAYGGAFLSPPGPLDKDMPSYYWITPPDETRGPDAIESYLREDNNRMLRLTCIHEAIPGHYLQLAWSNRSPSLARAVFWSGMFAEGWAVYATQVLMDAGYAEGDPALMLTHWKFYLRAITNAIMDVRIHTAGMTEEEAMELMVGGGFQEEHEARAKYLRARLTSTQLSTYYLGSVEMWDMEVDARIRAAESAGADRSAVPAQRIVGGLGETPGFEYRRHLEAVISHGTPPIKWVRRILASETPQA